VNVADDTLAGEGATNASGEYALHLDGWSGAAVRVEVLSELNDNLYDVDVGDSAAAPYVAVLGEYTPAGPGDVKELDLTLRVADDVETAAAFAILNSMLEGFWWAEDMTGRDLPALDVVYERDESSGGSRYSGDTAYIQSSPDDPMTAKSEEDRDDFDVYIHLHEFMHHAVSELTLAGGGGHNCVPPRTAFNEGIAQVLAQFVHGAVIQGTGGPVWHDCTADPPNSSCRPESMDWNTRQNMTQADWFDACSDPSLYSDGWVWRTVWDLMDGTSGEVPEPITNIDVAGDDVVFVEFGQFDGFEANPKGVCGVLVEYLGDDPENGALDEDARGAEGVDLVDFLDGWLCLGKGSATPEFQTFLDDVMNFPGGYDSGGAPGSCEP
jgi:hypothetical protein